MKTRRKSSQCQCIKCRDDRAARFFVDPHDFENFRYACEICGNKRCPHHSNHELKCTGSNEPGQPGSIYR